jgi:hypothetical protein
MIHQTCIWILCTRGPMDEPVTLWIKSLFGLPPLFVSVGVAAPKLSVAALSLPCSPQHLRRS